MNNDSPGLLRHPSQLTYWLFQLAGWGFLVFLDVVIGTALFRLSWPRATAEMTLVCGAALGFTHLLRAFAGRHRWEALRVSRLAVRIVAAGFVFGVPAGLLTQQLSIAVFHDPSSLFQQFPQLSPQLKPIIMTALQITNWAALIMLWQAIYFGCLALRRRRLAALTESELARALQLAELRLLKSQLNPHFLFNALNTVRALIAEDPSRAQSAVTRLANILRYTLGANQGDLVTFAQELEIVEEYLELESMRLEDRLSVKRDIDPATSRVRIPVMLLQTIVENAIKHGIAELPAGGVLRISAILEGNSLALEVENPRRRAIAPASHDGIGLRNAAERLRLLFGRQASLDLDLHRAEMATIRIRIPNHP